MEIIEQAGKILAALVDMVKAAGTPAGVAIVLGIGMTQVAKMLVAWKWQDVPKRGVWIISWIATVLIYPMLCLAIGVKIRENFSLGFIAGLIGPVVVTALKRVGIDIDSFFGYERQDSP